MGLSHRSLGIHMCNTVCSLNLLLQAKALVVHFVVRLSVLASYSCSTEQMQHQKPLSQVVLFQMSSVVLQIFSTSAAVDIL